MPFFGRLGALRDGQGQGFGGFGGMTRGLMMNLLHQRQQPGMPAMGRSTMRGTVPQEPLPQGPDDQGTPEGMPMTPPPAGPPAMPGGGLQNVARVPLSMMDLWQQRMAKVKQPPPDSL